MHGSLDHQLNPTSCVIPCHFDVLHVRYGNLRKAGCSIFSARSAAQVPRLSVPNRCPIDLGHKSVTLTSFLGEQHILLCSTSRKVTSQPDFPCVLVSGHPE